MTLYPKVGYRRVSIKGTAMFFGLPSAPDEIADALLADTIRLKHVVLTLFDLQTLPPFFEIGDSTHRAVVTCPSAWLRYVVISNPEEPLIVTRIADGQPKLAWSLEQSRFMVTFIRSLLSSHFLQLKDDSTPKTASRDSRTRILFFESGFYFKIFSQARRISADEERIDYTIEVSNSCESWRVSAITDRSSTHVIAPPERIARLETPVDAPNGAQHR
jgi:hypothetical protein